LPGMKALIIDLKIWYSLYIANPSGDYNCAIPLAA
jgi:hypothetical protein